MDKEELALFIGNKIKELRLLKNMTQSDLADLLKTTKQAIGRYENGSRRANQDTLFELADIFGKNIDDFLPKEDNVKSTKTILDNIFGKLEKPRQEIVINTAREQLDEQNKDKVIKLFPYNVQEKLSAGTGYGYFDDGNLREEYPDRKLIFESENGGVLSPSKPRKWLLQIIKGSDLKQITIHGFRHTHASLIFESGMTLKQAQHRLGHSDLQTTMNIYTHITQKAIDDIGEKFSKYVDF